MGEYYFGKNLNELHEQIERDRMKELKLIISLFDKYSKEEMDKEELKIIAGFYGGNGVQLPSHRYGNILALALELKLWEIADIIVESKGVETDSISSTYNGGDCISAEYWISYYKDIYALENEKPILEKLLIKIQNIKTDENHTK